MTGCLVIVGESPLSQSLGEQWFYPVIDPYRTAGPGPYDYGYVFAWDAVQITVTRNFSLSRCQMIVELSSSLAETKMIQAFNYFNNAWHSQIDSLPGGAVTAMIIMKPMPADACGVGTDTLVLARPGWTGPKAMYTFPSSDLWDFWGGCTVRFTWVMDVNRNFGPSLGPSGAQTPPPSYPAVRLPDGTLMRNAAGPGVSVVFGGTNFPADPGYLFAFVAGRTAAKNPATLAPDVSDLHGTVSAQDLPLVGGAIAFTALPPIPADFTLVQELNRPEETYIVFGGAKFRIPDMPTLATLGFDISMVRVIPAGGTSKLLTIPINGTLLKEQHDPHVFLVDNQKLRWVKSGVMEARCLPWRHVRSVPDTSLFGLPAGPDLELP